MKIILLVTLGLSAMELWTGCRPKKQPLSKEIRSDSNGLHIAQQYAKKVEKAMDLIHTVTPINNRSFGRKHGGREYSLSDLADTLIKADSATFRVFSSPLDLQSSSNADMLDVDWQWNDGEDFFIFKDTLKISDFSIFNSSNSLTNCIFASPFTLFSCHFQESDVVFNNCNFIKGFEISWCEFSSRFPHSLTIINSTLAGRCKFGTPFSGNTSVMIDTIRYSIRILGNYIPGSLHFSDTYFTKGFLFSAGGLPDTINFEGSTFLEPIDFTKAEPNEVVGKKCQLILSPSAADLVDLQYRYFHLTFLHDEFSDPGKKDYITGIYERLLNNFSAKGYNTSHALLDIEYKEWQEADDWTLRLSDVWWKFGYRKSRIIWWTIGLILVFSVVNNLKFSKLQSTYPTDNLRDQYYVYSRNVPRWIAGLRQFAISVLYTGFIFFKISVDFKNMKFDKMGYAILVIIEYTIGLVCTGFLINWILKS